MLNKLLNDTLETYYWIGYLTADGSIKNNGRRLSFSQTGVRKQQVERLANYINKPNNICYYNDVAQLSVQNKELVPAIAKKFGFYPRKTYNPNDLSWLCMASKDLLISFVIGLIDGDGCITYQSGRTDCRLVIKLHSSWFRNLQLLGKLISNVTLPDTCSITKRNDTAELVISNSITLKLLKQEALHLNLPFLIKKWNKINLDFVSRQERSQQRVIAVQYLLDREMTKAEIAKKLMIAPSSITLIIKRNNLKAYKGRK